jgi:uncharacterized protein
VNEIRDFTQVKNFPGTLDNEFDIVLRRFESIERIPAVVFALLLLGIAALAAYGRWSYMIGLWGFFLLDWFLIWLLPRYGVSFGPAKPSVLILAIARFPFGLLPIPFSFILQTLGTAMVFYGFWIEPHRLSVTSQDLVSTKLPSRFSIRILHLGDLHVERITNREKELNRQINLLKPDLILFSGDILNLSFVEDPVAIQQAREVISEWKAPMGVFVVSGSEAVDLEHIFPKLIAGLQVKWLQGETITLEKDGREINLTGLSCSHRPFQDAPILGELAKTLNDHFSVLLYHSPDLAPNAAQMGVDLQLSGHTHGGQVRIPFFGPVFTASLYGRRFQSGRYQLGKMVLYITRGIGLEGKAAPRVRFLCSPEIILWNVHGPITKNEA